MLLQGLYRFLDPKFITFSVQTFFQNSNNINNVGFLFPDSRLSKRCSIETPKIQKQSFFHDALQVPARDWLRFDQNEKNSFIKELCCSFDKKINSRLFTIFRVFPGLKNCWAHLKCFSRIQDYLYKPCTANHYMYEELKFAHSWAIKVKQSD